MRSCITSVLQTGPWLFDGRLIILKQWSTDSGLDRDLLSSVPVWIRFPNLHLKFWSQNNLSKLADLIGVPLYMDKATTSMERVAFARCFVEISANAPLKIFVWLEVEEEEKVNIDVEYEWIPHTCTKCKSFGHIAAQCPTKEVWRPVVSSSESPSLPVSSAHTSSVELNSQLSS